MEAPASRDLNSGLIIKAGWLHVHMETTFCCCPWGAWEKRYVVIRNNTVFIFSGETVRKPCLAYQCLLVFTDSHSTMLFVCAIFICNNPCLTSLVCLSLAPIISIIFT